ncbi:hypothetical protein DY000_02037498 [Brassica cretica]|uniref:Putative plant transposon protein domain-containing protein n=1 Tax=Brassica cretica TaxID=69181 RepID=A0ABQ7BBT4_BRACR|nr:hypothetical protein DY000_02037498 [Brassica cretica]
MSMNKSTSAAGKSSNPPLLNLVDYSDDEEQTTPQQSQTSQSMSEDLHIVAEQLISESDGVSEQVGSTRKKKNMKDGRSKQSSEVIPEEADTTKARKENRGKAIEVSSGESEEEDDSENTDSDEAEEVDAEDVEPLISTKAKITSGAAPYEKVKRGLTSAERLAEQRYASFASREIIPERSVDLNPEDTWGYLSIIKKGKLEKTVTCLGGYIPEIVKEFYSALPGEEVEVEATMDEVNSDELADFLTEGTHEMKNLTTSSLSPCKAALLVLAAYNWVPSSNKNAVSIDRAKFVYKMFHGVRVDIGVTVYNQVLNIGHVMQRKPREKLVPVTPYKKDPRLGEEYLKNQKEAREAEKKAQRQAKKKGKSASTSTASPPSRPPPSTPRPERTDPSGYVPPRQSPRSAGKFQIIHLGSIAAPGQPIDGEETKLALDTTSAAIQQLATAMQTLTSVVGQIASMMFPRGEEETDDPQQQDDQEN